MLKPGDWAGIAVGIFILTLVGVAFYIEDALEVLAK